MTTLDAKGRVAQIAVPGVLPVQLAYDAHGRLETVTQGARTLTRTYGPNGFLDGITDPLAQLHLFDMDAVGRMLSETRPDGEQVLYVPDAAGNQTSVTPPGQPAHILGYTPVDRLESYDPPALPTGPTPTSWDVRGDVSPLCGVVPTDGGDRGLKPSPRATRAHHCVVISAVRTRTKTMPPSGRRVP